MLIYSPQWQGSGEKDDIYRGSEKVFQNVQKDFDFTKLPSFKADGSESRNNILNYDSILDNLKSFRELLEREKPKVIFTLGGDCGLEVLPISYLKSIYQDDFSVLWLDAHGDLNTPESSPSNTFHGMPVRFLLGDGDPMISSIMFSNISPSEIVYLGVRDLDPPEEEFIRKNNIEIVGSDEIKREGVGVMEKIKPLLKKNVYIHLDLDILDPEELPSVSVPTEGGLSMSLLDGLLEEVHSSVNLVGASVLEFTGHNEKEAEIVSSYVRRLVEKLPLE